MRASSVALVTGAHGFVGRHVARALAASGFLVCGIGHGAWSREEYVSWGVTHWLCGDVTAAHLALLPHTPDIIVHCAGSGSVSFSHQEPLCDFTRTVTSTVEVLEYLRVAAPGSALVYPSSASVYGNAAQNPITEGASPAPVSQYGVHKWIAEQLIRSWAQRFALPATIVRLFSVYGPGLRKQLLWDACTKLAAGEGTFMGTGEEVRDWLHVEDAAALLVEAARHAQISCPTINGGSGEGQTVRAVLEQVAEALEAGAVTLRFSSVPRPGDPAVYVASMDAARSWSWQPRHPWKAGITDYVKWWMREHTVPAAAGDLASHRARKPIDALLEQSTLPRT